MTTARGIALAEGARGPWGFDPARQSNSTHVLVLKFRLGNLSTLFAAPDFNFIWLNTIFRSNLLRNWKGYGRYWLGTEIVEPRETEGLRNHSDFLKANRCVCGPRLPLLVDMGVWASYKLRRKLSNEIPSKRSPKLWVSRLLWTQVKRQDKCGWWWEILCPHSNLTIPHRSASKARTPVDASACCHAFLFLHATWDFFKAGTEAAPIATLISQEPFRRAFKTSAGLRSPEKKWFRYPRKWSERSALAREQGNTE